MLDGFRSITLDDQEYGNIKLLLSQPKKGVPWGVLESLKGTPWEPEIPVVSGDALSSALHGLAYHLMREIGPPPIARAKRIIRDNTEDVFLCALSKECIGYKKEICLPCKKVPGCYQASGLDPTQTLLASLIVKAWAENVYVIVVEGPEFSL